MPIFHWNPIRANLKDVIERKESTNQPIIFVPKNYVRQCKRKLYNNLLILLGGLWALSISHDVDIFEIEARVKLKNILGSIGLFVSHLLAVPLIICKLHLHYSIVLGAMGMSVTTFFCSLKNPLILSIVVSFRMIFVGLFDVSAMIYIVKLARMSSRIQGNMLYSELSIARSFTTVFRCTANVISFACRQYTQESVTTSESSKTCGTNYCPPRKLYEKSRLSGTLTIGQNTIFVAVAIVIALSGLILIAMYLKPIRSLGDLDLSDEPRISGPRSIFQQLRKPRAKHLAIMTVACFLAYEMTDEFALAYATCSLSMEYSFYVASMKEFSMIFGAMSCFTIVDFTGLYWLCEIAVLSRSLSYVCLVLWESNVLRSQLLNLTVYHVLCASISLETSIVQLLVIQTLGDEEVSAWCFYYAIGDVVRLLRTISDYYLCTGVKLWILIGASPVAMITLALFAYGFDEKLAKVSLDESCSLVVETSRKSIAKPITFDLKIIVDKFHGVRKIETFLERRYTLKSRSLVPPNDAVFSETLLPVDEP